MRELERQVIEKVLSTADPNEIVSDLRVCATWSVARTTRGMGMASTLAFRMGKGERPHVREAGRLLGRRAVEVARLALSDRPLESAIGMAVLNALTDPWALKVENLNAGDLLVELGRDKVVGIVGSFPFTRAVEAVAKRVLVFELREIAHTYGPKDYGMLSQADVVAVTGTVFLTHTLDQVLGHVSPDAVKIMVGPTTPMHPVIFDIGFHALCGIGIRNWEALLLGVSQGGSLKQIEGIEYLTALR